MANEQRTNLSTWTLWSPIKFALITFGIMIIGAIILSIIYSWAQIPVDNFYTPLLLTLFASIVAGAIIQIRTAPRSSLNRPTFITIQNTQTIILSALFLLSSYLILLYNQEIMLNLLLMETHFSSTFLLTLSTCALFYLYLIGLFISNFYAKFSRIRTFNIPTWKIILSIPFGFSALWTPGYILDHKSAKTKSNSNITNWIISKPANTIATYIAIILVSGFFFGFNSVLLTYALALIFGIWTIQVGPQKFIKTMPGKYSTAAVVFNITLLLIILCFKALVPPTTQAVQINISDTPTPTQITNQ